MKPLLLLLTLLLASTKAENTYNVTTAYEQLMFSYSAYCSPNNILSFSCYWCLYKSHIQNFVVQSVVFNATSNIFGFVGYSGNAVQVAFRGTQPASLANWLTDIAAEKLDPYPDVPNADVHRGFYNAYKGVRTQIQEAIKTVISKVPKVNQIYVTGHSLGGALAAICSLDLVESKFNLPVTVYSFGEPRVGNKAFSQYYNALIPNNWRVVNKADIVPHVPTESMRYFHVSTEVWYKTGTSFIVCYGSGEDPSCSDSELVLLVTDHWDYLGTDILQGGCVERPFYVV